MDSSTGSSCPESTSPDSPTVSTLMMQGDDADSVHLETLSISKTGASSVKDSVMTQGKESNTVKISTERQEFLNFHPRVINRTAIKFSEEEWTLLNKSLKFNIEPVFDKKLAKQLIMEAYRAVERLKLKVIDRWRVGVKLYDAIDFELKNGVINQKSRAYQSTIESINKKLSEEKSIVRKADEGDFLVIVKEEEYIEKTLSYFEENSISEIPYDITDEFEREIPARKLLRCIKLLFGNVSAEKYFNNTTPPKLRALLKVHKDDIYISPIVDLRGSPVHPLTIMLYFFLNKCYTFSNNYSVHSFMDLINEIKDKPITNLTRLASMSITNLYANIPVDETIEIIEHNLLEHKKAPKEVVNEVVDLLKSFMKLNYFSFNNKFYKQNIGLAMGPKLSDIMSDIFINNLEQNVLKSDDRTLMDKIIYYRRCVDNILLVVDGAKDDIDSIVTKFNSSHMRIHFSVEHESSNRVQFLDLEITRLDNQLAFNIFRKPTTTDAVIPNDSCHSQIDKEAEFRRLLHRAYYVPMREADRSKELDIIRQIADNNGYEMDMVSQLMDEERRNATVEDDNDERIEFSVPYYGQISDKLVDIFSPYSVKLKFQAKNLVAMRLRRHVGNGEKEMNNSGIYKVQCASKQCGAIYIGQTNKTFFHAYNQHMDNIRLGRNKPVAKHMSQQDHKLTGIIEEDLEVLHVENNIVKRDLLETLEITIHKHIYGNAKILNVQRSGAQIGFFDGFVELFRH